MHLFYEYFYQAQATCGENQSTIFGLAPETYYELRKVCQRENQLRNYFSYEKSMGNCASDVRFLVINELFGVIAGGR